MGTLNSKQIRKLVQEGQLIIDPFDDALVQPASYDLLLGRKILASPLGPNTLGQEFVMDENTPTYSIQTGQMVAVMSKEWLVLPLTICSNSFGIRSEFARKGLQCFGGPQLDPGWRGHLIVGLQNIGPEPISIGFDQPFFTVTFDRLDEPLDTGEGYQGRHQDQDDYPEDQKEYILNARTSSLAEIPTLRENVARLAVVVEQLNDMMPDPDAGFEINRDLVDQLRRSLERAPEFFLSPEDMLKRLDL